LHKLRAASDDLSIAPVVPTDVLPSLRDKSTKLVEAYKTCKCLEMTIRTHMVVVSGWQQGEGVKWNRRP
jgi:hypothetical protein